MKTAFEVVSSSGERIRPVAIVAPMCRSSSSSSSSSSGSSGSWSPVASSTTAVDRSIVTPSRDPAMISMQHRQLAPWTRHISLQTNHADAVPFIVIDSLGRRRSEKVSSTKPANRRKTRQHRGSSHSTLGDSSSVVQRSSSLSSGQRSKPASRDLAEEAVRSCNFYYVNLSNDAAKALLQTAPVGTFLLRDSSDRRFRYSLSVKTARGTTSVRVAESESSGRFRLDCDPHQKSPMSSFASILELVEHYCHLSNGGGGGGGRGGGAGGHCVVLLESSGRSDTPMLLRRPLELSPAPLAHLCRRLVNRLVDGEEQRERLFDRTTGVVGAGIKEEALRYLVKYPFRV